MKNISTLNNINRSDTSIAGFKAVDLATLYNKKINIPVCFVIETSFYDAFFERNVLKDKIAKIVSEIDYTSEESLEEAYSDIKDLFTSAEFSKEEENEIVEAYETLAIDMDHLDIARLVTTIDKPYLTLIGSTNYVDDSENNETVIQNVKEKASLLKAIKNCWLSMYTTRSLKYRKENEIENKEKMAIIVQRMIESQVSAQTYSDEEDIIVKSFLGYQDYEEEFGKDITVFSKGVLNIKNNKINIQEHEYARNDRDNNLIKKPLKEMGEKQKINDKEAEELARITKKIEGILEKTVKVFFGLMKGKIYVLFANRVIRTQTNQVDEEEIKDETPTSQEADTNQDSMTQPTATTPEDIQSIPNPSADVDSQTTNVQPQDAETIDLSDLDNDIAFLDQIESYEKDKNTDTVDEHQTSSNTEKHETVTDWDASPKDEETSTDMKQDESHEQEQQENIDVHSQEEATESKDTKVDKHTDIQMDVGISETNHDKSHEPEDEETQSSEAASAKGTKSSVEPKDKLLSMPKPEVLSKAGETKEESMHDKTGQEGEVNWDGDESSKEIPKDDAEETVKMEEEPEDDEFIFSQFETNEESKKLDHEEPEKIEPEKEETKPEGKEVPDITSEASDDGLENVLEELKRLTILSNNTIYERLKKKHRELFDSEPESFEEAIRKIKGKIRIPFIDEIKEAHEMGKRVENGEEIDVDQASEVLRTTKNFLNMFE